jgi:colicin import membrane protein
LPVLYIQIDKKMKTKQLKINMLLIIVLLSTTIARAQKPDSAKHTYYVDRYSNYDITDNKTPGKLKERIRTNWKDKVYEMTLVNNKMTELYVEGEKIPAANWGHYSTVIGEIREQIRKDKIQAKKDQAQARLDQIQARKDQEQARRDQLQANRDQQQAKKDQQQALEESKRDQEEARLDQIQAKKDQEEAAKDQEQAKRDQEEARLDQIQAKKDQEEARKEQELMKQMIADLISDKIIPNEKSLQDLTLSPDEMTVNGVKQPDDVFKRYKEKYNHFAMYNLSYGNRSGEHQYQGIHISHKSDN